ncbi:ATP-binding protein [Uliginosibacterium sp. H3]|uniref:histidine kinase n=1 Tax=Uliginosibacterium silvisoli TaxID=3114758 RepID=A0ABU6K7V6_9RHOO|nr:ATP-binding protein [Uliginosibacterium sp. H3]
MITDDTDYFSNVMVARTPTLTRLSDEQGVYRFFNDRWLRFTGRAQDEELGNGWLRSVHADDRAAVVGAGREAIAAQADVEIQFRLLRRDGTYRWMLERASPWRHPDGSFGGLVSACTDITSLKTPPASNVADRRAARLPAATLRVSADQTILFSSPEAEALFNVRPEALEGLQLTDAAVPDALRQTIGRLLQQAADSSSAHAEIEFSLRVGMRETEVDHHLAASVIDDGLDVVTHGSLILIHDITACVEAQNLHRESLMREELARQSAEASARSRDQFLSVVSHELRSPLNGIQSWAHVLESQIDSGRPIVQRALAGIKTGVTQQVALIEALLDATQILNGHLSLLSRPYSLSGTVQAALDTSRDEAEHKKIDITFMPDFSDVDMVGDADRVQQIVRQLISNAIKFTDDGGDVRIGVTREAANVVVSVEDNGHGIAPSMLASVFEPFRQADGSPTRRAAGLGLGLAVSRRIAELQGGSLQCESEGVGHGATFRLILPLPI